MGRGPARRLEIVSEKTEIQAGGADFTIVRVKRPGPVEQSGIRW